ncbi:septation protein IspZ [Brevundimonas variabilis]|uniref:Intracellular septation protein A n=1 Tax=Brevundimonas variabilis TaxID=74312 RepID=A0A7W9CJW9_9CAUL|nr:septation protein IspZ [Brevundimonas variabilis]MBB5746839.1 intracellular septation protein A [Brevundimonas variabilis]
MPIRLSRLNRTFTLDGQTLAVEHEVFMDHSRSALTLDGQVVARDGIEKGSKDLLRNHWLVWTRPDGRVLEVEIGPATTWSYGIAARLDGEVVHESHPGSRLAYGPGMQKFVDMAEASNSAEMQARSQAAWKRNWPSLATDVSLGLIFFFVAREYGLVTAAVGGAGAGLALWVVQRITKIDLLGGLAVFGIAMSLVSAAFALIFQDDRIIQHRSTILGVIGAVPFLLDGWLGKGQKLAARLARYFAFDVDARRLAIGMGLIGLVSAGMNATAVALLSRDAWLVFTTFLDVPIVMVLFLSMLWWVRKGPEARAY